MKIEQFREEEPPREKHGRIELTDREIIERNNAKCVPFFCQKSQVNNLEPHKEENARIESKAAKKRTKKNDRKTNKSTMARLQK